MYEVRLYGRPSEGRRPRARDEMYVSGCGPSDGRRLRAREGSIHQWLWKVNIRGTLVDDIDLDGIWTTTNLRFRIEVELVKARNASRHSKVLVIPSVYRLVLLPPRHTPTTRSTSTTLPTYSTTLTPHTTMVHCGIL